MDPQVSFTGVKLWNTYRLTKFKGRTVELFYRVNLVECCSKLRVRHWWINALSFSGLSFHDTCVDCLYKEAL